MPADCVDGLVIPDVNDLSIEALRGLVANIQEILWLDARHHDPATWDLDKEWSSDTTEAISAVMEDYGLRPKEQNS